MSSIPGKAQTTPAASGRAMGGKVLIVGAAAVVVLVALAIVVWRMRPADTPRLNADTITLASFVSSEQYTKLPFSQQELYMKVLEDRDDNDELERAYKDRRLSEAQYRAAIQEAWLGQQLKRSQAYAALPAGPARAKYINSLLNKKVKKDQAENKRPSRPGSQQEEDDIKRDPTATELRVASWPAQVREQYLAFRRAYDEAKEARDAANAQPAQETAPASAASAR